MFKMKLISLFFVSIIFFSCSVEGENEIDLKENIEIEINEQNHKVRLKKISIPILIKNRIEIKKAGTNISVEVFKDSSWKAREIDIYIESFEGRVNLVKNFNILSRAIHNIIHIPSSTPSGSYRFYIENSNDFRENRYFGSPFIVINNNESTSLFWRYFNSRNGDHFYTNNFNEISRGSLGYKLEGVACKIFKKSTGHANAPLYRYYNSESGDHFYTTNYNELGSGSGGYRLEGIQCYVLPN